MSALAELRSGQPGAAFSALLTKTVFAVGKARNFPPPSGGAWTADDAQTVAAAFLGDRQTPRRLADLVLHCGDDRALAARLQGAVRNFLRDRGRATEVGKLIVRLKRALRASASFAPAGPDRWALQAGPGDPSAVDHAVLEQAAAAVEIVIPNWSSDRRNPPFADKVSIEALLVAVLLAAGGSMTVADIANVIAPRLAVAPRSLVLEADVGDHPDTSGADASADETGGEVANRMRAMEVLMLLTDRQRIALAFPELGVRELGPLVGVSHSQAQVVRQQAVAAVRSELCEEEEGQQVAELVLEFARKWVEDRTERPGGT